MKLTIENPNTGKRMFVCRGPGGVHFLSEGAHLATHFESNDAAHRFSEGPEMSRLLSHYDSADVKVTVEKHHA